MIAKRRSKQTAKRAAKERGLLVVLSGGPVGRKYPVSGCTRIGRDVGADITFDDDEVSREHAQITRSGAGTFWLEDLESTNGTRLNGEPVRETALRPGDKIQIGSAVLEFTHHDTVHEALRQRQRLEALGRLTAGVTHDFNNMLAVVLTGLQHMKQHGMDPELAECVDDVWSAASRAAELTPRLLAFARSHDGHGLVDVATVCHEVIRLAERTFERSIEVRAELTPNLRVWGSSVELHQAIMNLCLNARDAMPDGGILIVSVSPAGDENAMVGVTVRDNGAGMTPQVRERVFDPFFSTKAEGAGFGLGLATVRDIVRAHGGRIDVASALGLGTTIRMALPAAPPRQAGHSGRTERPREAVVPPSAGGATILVVDDEPLVRRSLSRLLKRAGFRVLEASDGPPALELYAQHPRPDLVVLDLDMPMMSGEETLRALIEIDPNVRALMSTGHADSERLDAAMADGAVGLLRKPFDTDALLAMIHAGRAHHKKVTPPKPSRITPLKALREGNPAATLRGVDLSLVRSRRSRS